MRTTMNDEAAPDPVRHYHEWRITGLAVAPISSRCSLPEGAAIRRELDNTPMPLPATTLWHTWQRLVAQDPLEAAAWYQTLSAANQATLSALTLAQVAAALGKAP